jgi:hypothetical protein
MKISWNFSNFTNVDPPHPQHTQYDPDSREHKYELILLRVSCIYDVHMCEMENFHGNTIKKSVLIQ